MIIRPFESSDADALATLFHWSIHEAGRRYYSDMQVKAWSPSRPEPERYLRQSKERTFLVAIDDAGEPIGYGDLIPNGHIDHLYCRPDRVGTGVGSAIYAALEDAARTAALAVLYVDASEGARLLFERRGFKIVVRNDFVLNGIAIHNYRMSKSLA